MTFPVWYILLPFLGVVAFAGLFLFFNVYHIQKFSIDSGQAYAILALYVGGFFIIFGMSLGLLSRYDWSVSVDPLAVLHLNTGSNASQYGL